jgi:hypothetical protein
MSTQKSIQPLYLMCSKEIDFFFEILTQKQHYSMTSGREWSTSHIHETRNYILSGHLGLRIWGKANWSLLCVEVTTSAALCLCLFTHTAHKHSWGSDSFLQILVCSYPADTLCRSSASKAPSSTASSDPLYFKHGNCFVYVHLIWVISHDVSGNLSVTVIRCLAAP